MPIVNRVADLLPDIVSWRRDIHAHPELGFDVNRTSAVVADRLREFGCDQVVSGLGKTGVVGVITGKRAASDDRAKVIGLRADMDALPIEEKTNLPYASKTEGFMHACGHDGHTAMLLGAARYLAETRDFAGTVVLIFQPAEEIGMGAVAMLKDDLMERFGVEQVYGMHTLPGLPIGAFGIRRGAVLAATDSIEIKIEGRGGHPGMPHKSVDAILVGAQLITAVQQILSQNVDPLEAAGITFHEIRAGSTHRVVAETAELRGSMRTLTPEVRQLVKKRLREVVAGIGQVTGARIDLNLESDHGVVFNHAAQTEMAIRVAKDVAGEDNVVETLPVLGGEDFAFMSEARPGAFIWCGNGDSAGLHQAAYDFNDEAIQFGTSYWIKLAENTLAA
ncbi:M20 family metallopeptidase [Mesorhizobium sp. M0848]|uniref:M20 aminoacylase family protein n=1 Tax=Mesorhizobium sp. M0848 TaxID=2957012 RepID=UPI003336697A